MRIFAIVIVAALALGGCASLNKSVFEGGISVTAPVQNPVTRQQQAAIEGSVALVREMVLTYGRLPRCAAGTSFSLTNRCSTGPLVRKLKRANRIVEGQLQNLRAFMDNNETVNAINAYNALRATILDLQATVNANGLNSVTASR